MRAQPRIHFSDWHTQGVCPSQRPDLAPAISELGLKGRYPVIVLIGGAIDPKQAAVTQRAIQTISMIAEDMKAVVISGGTDMGVMAEIGQVRSRNRYRFPLIGITPKGLATWPGGPRSTKFLWWGKQRWQLASHYSHFILVPGREFGDESSWILDTATILSKDQCSVTILINGGEVSRKDIRLSLEIGRPVIVLSGTGRLADELASDPGRNRLITVIPAHAAPRIVDAVRAVLSMNGNARSGRGEVTEAVDRLKS